MSGRYAGGGRNAGGGDAGYGGTAQGTSQSGHSGGYGRGNTGGSQAGRSNNTTSSVKSVAKKAVQKATKVAEKTGVINTPKSVYTTQDPDSRVSISQKTYDAANRAVVRGLQAKAKNGGLSGHSAKFMSDYNRAKMTRNLADVGAFIGAGPLGLAATNMAATAMNNNQLGSLGTQWGAAHGGLGLAGINAGSMLGSFLGPIGGLVGSIAGGLYDKANPQYSWNAGAPIGSGNGNGHPALSNNQGGSANGNRPTSDLGSISTAPTPEKTDNEAFDWGQWSHLYTPLTVQAALTQSPRTEPSQFIATPMSRNLGALPRGY